MTRKRLTRGRFTSALHQWYQPPHYRPVHSLAYGIGLNIAHATLQLNIAHSLSKKLTDPAPKPTTDEDQRTTIGDLARIFTRLADEPPERQDQMLNDLCPDEDTRQKVRAMLDADAEVDPLLDHSLFPEPKQINLGEKIAGYNLVRELGHGGMGVVFEAEQQEPVRRTVALKVIKPGVDTREVIERFNAERQALSMMNHPNIAKVLEAGSTELGRPFFVMELVNGKPITAYCDEKKLTPTQRLELFLPVCHAIQHAHQKGIIHRDIKPSNVLVAEYDERPVAKVIDFGVAKAINQSLDRSSFTRVGQIVGTFEYMSPEQSRVDQSDVDTRSDIYSLGVVLYELLTGNPPFDRERLRSVDWDEMLQILREEDPPRPSARLSSARLSSTRRSNSRHFRDELDWIVMKAMDKDPGRRYMSPNDLANDVECYLRGDAVAACPPSAAYLFRKFARRNKVAIATSAMVCASLVLGMIGTTWQAIRATRAETKAEAHAEKANEVSDYLKELLFGLVDSKSQLSETDPSVWMVSFFKKAADDADQRFANLPEISRELDSMFASTLSSLGDFQNATTLFEKTLQSLETEKGPRDPDTIAVRSLLAKSYIDAARWDDARKQCEQALRDGSELEEASPLLLGIRNDLGTVFHGQGLYSQAVETYQTCLDSQRNSLGENHYETLLTKSRLASVFESLKQFDKAEALYNETLNAEARKSDEEGNGYRMGVARSNLGKCFLRHGRQIDHKHTGDAHTLFAKSANLLRQSLDFFHSDRGPYASHTLDTQFHLAHAFNELGDYDSAATLLEEVEEHSPKQDTQTNLSVLNVLGWTYLRQSRFADAEGKLKAAYESLGESPEELRLQVMENLSITYNRMGKLGDAISLDRQTLELAERLYGSDHPTTLSAKARIGLGFLEQGDTTEGRALLEHTFHASHKLAGAGFIADVLAASYRATGEFEKAETWAAKKSKVTSK